MTSTQTKLKMLKLRLIREFKKLDTISDETMEKLEDKYHVDLTHSYGVEDVKDIDTIINKLKKLGRYL